MLRRNALHFAVSGGFLEVVKLIIKENEKLVNSGDRDGWTPLHWAFRRSMQEQGAKPKEVIKYLLDHGADSTAMGTGYTGLRHSWAPYHVGKYYGIDDDMVQLVKPRSSDIGEPEVFSGEFKENSCCDFCNAVSACPPPFAQMRSYIPQVLMHRNSC